MRLALLLALTMTAFAANSLLNRFAVDGGYIDPAGFAVIRVASGAVVLMAALMPFYYKPMPVEHLGMFFALSALGFIATLCVITAYKRGEAVTVAPMQYSQIIWAAIFGAVFFEEVLDVATGVGAAVVIASGVYIVLRESISGKSANTPVLRTRSRFEAGGNMRVSQILRRSGWQRKK